MQFRHLPTCLCAAILIFGVYPFAHAATTAIELKNIAEVEMQVMTDDGKKELKRLPAKNVAPDGEVIYTTTFRNASAETVNNVIVINPIPQNTLYIANSAAGNNTDITYSLNGKNYATPENLQVPGAHGKGRPAIASDYSNIRWVYKDELAPGAGGTVTFRVKVR